MAQNAPTYTLTRASHQDMQSVAELLYESFDDFARANYFGTATRNHLPKLADRYARIMSTDGADIWVKVQHTSTGAIVAASNWKLYLGSETAQPRVRDEPAPWLDDDAATKSRLLLEPMNEARERANPGPFMYLHILATHPDHRRKGLGAAMMRWGVDTADSLCLPAWIEASPEGNFLYRRFGFRDYEEIRRDDELLGRKGEVLGMTMRREARETPVKVIA